MKIGRFSYSTNLRVIEHPGVKLKIGNFCSLAPNVRIFLGKNHRTDWITTYPFGDIYIDVFGEKEIEGHPSTNGDVVIGNDVWIGQNATIMSGVTIGDGAVIAANSHVVKSVHPYEVVGGNPARHIKYRFSPEIVRLLLELKWWDKSVDEIRALIPVLMDHPNVEMLEELCKLHSPD